MANNPGSVQSQNFLVITGYSSLIAAFLLFGVVPIVRGMSTTRAEISECKGEIESRQSNKQQLEDIQKLVKSINLDTQDYDRLVPQNQDLSPFLTLLYQEWDKAGMKDVSVRSLPPTTLGRSQKLPIEIRGRGSYAQFHTFLERLENLQRLSSVGRLSIDSDVSMNGSVEVQLTLFIYNTKPTQ